MIKSFWFIYLSSFYKYLLPVVCLSDRLKRSHGTDQRQLETTDHKRPNKHFLALWSSFKTNKMRSGFGTTVMMKKPQDNVLCHNYFSSSAESVVSLSLYATLVQNIVAVSKAFLSDL